MSTIFWYLLLVFCGVWISTLGKLEFNHLKVYPELLCASCWMLALCGVIASVAGKTCTTSSAPCSICCYCLRLCMASWWCREGLLPINDSIQYRSSSSWLVNSEQSAPTLIEMKSICLLGCRTLDQAFRPHGNWQNGLSKAFRRPCPISQHKHWWH